MTARTKIQICRRSLTNPSTSLCQDFEQYPNPTPDPTFACIFEEERDDPTLAKHLILEFYLSKYTKRRTTSFVKEYFDIFNEGGLSIPI